MSRIRNICIQPILSKTISTLKSISPKLNIKKKEEITYILFPFVKRESDTIRRPHKYLKRKKYLLYKS